MSDPIDDYANRLTRALRQRGLDDPRFVSESREHLLDMVAEGRRRGLSLEEAEREAFDRFGAPEIVAAHALSEGDRPMSRLAAALDTIWQRKWWIVVPAAVTAMITTVAATYLLPTRYRSEAVIDVTPQRVPEYVVAPIAADRAANARFQQIESQILSRTRLERIISDFGLYETRRDGSPTSELVTRMRRDLAVSLISSGQTPDGDGSSFAVSFVAADPTTAVRVTERVASLFIEENLRDREMLVEGVGQFLDSQIADSRRRIIEYEQRLDQLRAEQGNRPLSRADLLPYEVLQESYRNLLLKAEEARLASGIERRQIGDQFRIIDPPRLPDEPVGPSRVSVTLWGAFAGVGVGLLIVGVRSRSTQAAA